MTVRKMINLGIISEDEAEQVFPNFDYSPTLSEAEKRLARRIPDKYLGNFKVQEHYSFPILLPYEERIEYAKLDTGQGIPVLRPGGIDVAIAGQTLNEVIEILEEKPVSKVSKTTSNDVVEAVTDIEDIGFGITPDKTYTGNELFNENHISWSECFLFPRLDIRYTVPQITLILGRKVFETEPVITFTKDPMRGIDIEAGMRERQARIEELEEKGIQYTGVEPTVSDYYKEMSGAGQFQTVGWFVDHGFITKDKALFIFGSLNMLIDTNEFSIMTGITVTKSDVEKAAKGIDVTAEGKVDFMKLAIAGATILLVLL